MKNLFAFLFGSIFALGLLVSGMSNPEKVLSFLDVFGAWDISLMFVMIGAIVVAFIPFQKALRSPKTLLGESMALPNNNQIDKKLIAGAGQIPAIPQPIPNNIAPAINFLSI